MTLIRQLPDRSRGLASVMRLVSATRWPRAHPLMGLGIAFIGCCVAAVLRHALDPYLPPGFPFLTFFPVVILTAFFFGLWPGVFSAVIGGLLAWYYFIPPTRELRIDLQNSVAMLFYTFIVSVDIVLIHFMHRSSDRLTEEEAQTRRLNDDQRVMFQELQHRVANNIQFIASLLNLQRRKVVSGEAEAAVAVLDDARLRLESMSRIHRQLYDPMRAHMPVATHISELASDMLHATSARNVDVRVDMAAVTLDLTRLTTLSLLIAEVLTNSLKHAFADTGGRIEISLQPTGDGLLRLTVADNGRGLPEAFDPDKSKGLGWRIVNGLAQQLGGKLTLAGRNGTSVTLVFPEQVSETAAN
jgi:two-component sensor histidine kinase